MRFLDTNVLLYRISEDPAERDKAEVAANLLQATDLALSVQVLQEFYVQATRTTRQNRLSHDEALALVTPPDIGGPVGEPLSRAIQVRLA